MPVPHTSTNFPDLLDKRITKVFNDEYDQLPDLKGEFYNVMTSSHNEERWSQVGAMPDINQFTGTIIYGNQNQGYDTTFTHVEFAGGVQIERTLFDDDRFNIMDQRPKALANAANRREQKDAARVFNMAFSVDTFFYNNSEGVALCSNNHTTTSGASTAVGFDNLTTAALSATSMSANRIAMVNFRGDQAERISIMPSLILIPPDQYETAYEIVSSMGKVDTAQNNANVHYGQYKLIEWNYLTDANNYFLIDGNMMKQFLLWYDRIRLEFGQAEEFDSFIGKWRCYRRYSNGWTNWRWILGAQVS